MYIVPGPQGVGKAEPRIRYGGLVRASLPRFARCALLPGSFAPEVAKERDLITRVTSKVTVVIITFNSN